MRRSHEASAVLPAAPLPSFDVTAPTAHTQPTVHGDRAPALVRALGFGGLLPFIGGALALWLAPAQGALALQALAGYGAVILSFVGALHWGLALRGTSPAMATPLYAWSVVPSLLGWLALLLMAVGQAAPALLVLVGGFVAHLRQDWRLAARLDLPRWYLPLRLQLTAVASLYLLAALVLTLARAAR